MNTRQLWNEIEALRKMNKRLTKIAEYQRSIIDMYGIDYADANISKDEIKCLTHSSIAKLNTFNTEL